MMKKIRCRNDDKGFTLVELIVVLVILAILAAVLVPALLGYIDRAKQGKDLIAAKNMLQATQAELSALYARPPQMAVGKFDTLSILPDAASPNKKGDVNGEDSDFAKAVRATADDDPYFFMAGLGHTKDYNNATDRHKMYTIYYAVYISEKGAAPLFYDGKNWGLKYPTKDGNNVTTTGINFQYYVIADKWGFDVDAHGQYWTELKQLAVEK